MANWQKLDGATLSSDLKSVEFQSAKIGNFYVEKAGGMYKFYDADGIELTDKIIQKNAEII